MRARPASVDFHFDVMCPYAYQTSLWIREVRGLTGLEVSWRFFSLEEVNRAEGKKHPWEREWSYGWSMMRIGALLRRRSMADLDAWYARAGRALHVEGLKPHLPEVARALLEEMGFSAALVDEAIADPTTNDEVLADHRRVADAGGFGVPTLFFPDGQCLYGPVLVDPPSAESAVRLWDAVLPAGPRKSRFSDTDNRLTVVSEHTWGRIVVASRSSPHFPSLGRFASCRVGLTGRSESGKEPGADVYGEIDGQCRRDIGL